jgi:hypothetical protein
MMVHQASGDRRRRAGTLGAEGRQRRRRSRRADRTWVGRRIEALEPRALLTGGADLLMSLENSRVMALVPDGSFQDIAVNTGDWSSPATWKGGAVPKDMDNVLISPNVTVTISGDVAKDAAGNRVAIHALRVDGTLTFDASSLSTNPNPLRRLLVDTIVISPPSTSDPTGGTFQMGTMSSPIPQGVTAEVVFADNGPVNAPANTDSALSTLWPDGDPYQFSRGLLVLGAASIDGTEVTSQEPVQPGPTGETYLGPTSSTSPPVTTFTLAQANAPTNWNVGDRLIITGKDPSDQGNYNVDEQVAIKAISTDPTTGVTTVTINQPLQHLHYAPAGASIYVADVSRNAVFESENVVQVADRGHVMFMHTMNVQVDAAGFYGLGRTDKRNPIDDPNPVIDPANPGTPAHPNYTDDVIDATTGQRVMVPEVDANGNPVLGPDGKPILVVARTGLDARGRYAVHFHHDMAMDGMTGPMMPDTINDSAVVDSPGWGIVNHSSDVDVTYNVVFNALGAAFVTEAGDEIGSFDHNIAIQSQGAPGGIEGRKQFQDFGFLGDGFWFQGGNISVTNNIATGQNGSGFVFFPVGLVQKLPVSVGPDGKLVFQEVTTKIPASALTWAPWAPTDPTAMVADGDVPLKQFANNVSVANGDGFESWFSLLGVTDPRVTTVIDGLRVYQSPVSAVDVFTPYTHKIVFNDTILLGNTAYRPLGSGFSGNGETASVTYNHVDVRWFSTGIYAPLKGSNTIIAGTFQNIQSIAIFSAMDPNRLIQINDDPITGSRVTFLDLPAAALGQQTQYSIDLEARFNPAQQDITQLFSPDVIKLGTVDFNGKQLYYVEQAANFVPFPTATAASYIPAALKGQTNAAIFNSFGLAIGGIMAPLDAVTNPPGIHGILGSTSTYATKLSLISAKYTQFDPANPDYLLVYSYVDPATGSPLTVQEATKTRLAAGWNLLTRSITIDGKTSTRTLLVYGDDTAPSFTIGPNVPLTINRADWDNGANWVISGIVSDDSFGSRGFELNVKLGDPKFFPDGVLHDAQGDYVIFKVIIRDMAGNQTLIAITLRLSATAPLQKDLGRKDLPDIIPSPTLIAILDPNVPPKH